MNFNISLAQKSDALAVKRLFLNCFDDTLSFVNMFFDNNFVPENTVVAKLGDKIVAEAIMLPCKLEDRDCYYIYGVCTHLEYRNMGLGSKILGFIKTLALSRGASCILHHADDSLLPFYSKNEFLPCAYTKEITVAPTGESIELLPVSAKEYKTIRDLRFKESRPVVWSHEAVAYALAQETFFGGRYFKFKIDECEHIVLCVKDGGDILIKEISTEENINSVCAALVNLFGGDGVKVRLAGTESDTPTALGFGISGTVYLNLMLD